MSERSGEETRPRPVLAVVGTAGEIAPAIDAMCAELGRRAIEARFRVVTGGLGGVMAAVSRGARSAPSWQDGDIVGVLPGYDRRAANPFVDIAVPTGMQIARNVIVVAMADVVVAVAGGAGTLSELAIAWQLDKPIIALTASGGWAERLDGARIDARRRDAVHRAATPADAIALAVDLAARGGTEPGEIGSGWRRG